MCQCEFFGHDERRREEIAEDRRYQGASFLSLIGVSFYLGASLWVLHSVWEIKGYLCCIARTLNYLAISPKHVNDDVLVGYLDFNEYVSVAFWLI